MMQTEYGIAVAVWLGSLSTALAVERFVPQGGALNYLTIQAAIAASAAGDVVRVQPGTYHESLTLSNIDITLTSSEPLNPAVVRSTVIEGDGLHSVVTLTGNRTRNMLLTGFTIRGGGGTILSPKMSGGGGIYCFQSNASIIGNIIEENRVATNRTLITCGGGIQCYEASPVIARNIVRHNDADNGGGINTIDGSPRIQDNWICDNTARGGGGAAINGGQFLNNTLSGNAADNLRIAKSALVVNNIFSRARSGYGVVVWFGAGNVTNHFGFNNVWGNNAGGMTLVTALTNSWFTWAESMDISMADIAGNFSEDPQFLSGADSDFQLSSNSSCINAGDLAGIRSAEELDLGGESRVHALRVDVGASEYQGQRNYPPIARAGGTRTVLWKGDEPVTLDGSDSVDPDGGPLRFAWSQTFGPTASLTANNAWAVFTPVALGKYGFALVVNDGVHDSNADEVQVIVTNLPPIASAGLGQTLRLVPDKVELDGSHSMDPEGQPLTFQWRQVTGPEVQWLDADAAHASFRPFGSGVYTFELTVREAFNSSLPDRVTLYIGSVAPVGNAGPTRYAARVPVLLDGSRSFAPNGAGGLAYGWRQMSGPPLTLEQADTACPVVKGFLQLTNQVQIAVFELVVRSGEKASLPATVSVVIVPTFKNAGLSFLNPPFKPDKPTIVGFSGGDCRSGYAETFLSDWQPLANLFTATYNRDPDSSVDAPTYFGYGDQLITMLSSNAPAYDQPIQTLGFSTGTMPACDVAEQLNLFYQDPRFLVNRITLLDSGCTHVRDYSTNIARLLAQRRPGQQFWIDNYYSVGGWFRSETLNVEFPVPPAEHTSPDSWYFPSWKLSAAFSPTTFNNGVFAGAFFSLAGPGKNYQLEMGQSEYYFGWTPPTTASFPLGKLIQMRPALCPGRLPGLVRLEGPVSGEVVKPRSIVFSCGPVLNAAKYQILVGPSAHQLDWVVWEGTAPPTEPLSDLPFATTHWTVRAVDPFGTSSQADPRYVCRDNDGDGLSDELEVLVYQTNPDQADTDGDGLSDAEATLASDNSEATVKAMRFHLEPSSKGRLLLSWYAEAGRTYDVDYSPGFSTVSWKRLETITAPPAGGMLQRSIPKPAGSSAGFYLVQARARQ